MRRLLLFSLLAFIGLGVGQQLDDLIARQSFRRVAQVGQDLVAAHSSPKGDKVVGLRHDNGQWSVCVYSFSGEELLEPLPVPQPSGYPNRIAWSEDGRFCAVAAGTNVLHLSFQGKPKARELAASWQVREVRFCGSRLLARSDGKVYIWNGTQPEWRVSADNILHADLSRDGRYLAVGIFNAGVYLVDLHKRETRYHFDYGLTPAFVRFCADDQRLLTAYRIREDRRKDHAIVYDLRSGNSIGSRILLRELASCAASADGSRLMAHSAIGPSVWNVQSGEMLSNPKIKGAWKDAFSPDGNLVATAVRDSSQVLVWNAVSGKTIATLPLKNRPNYLQFSTSKQLDITGNICEVWQECSR